MTTHTPFPCVNSPMVSYSGKILLLDQGGFPNYGNSSWVFNGSNGNNDWTNVLGNNSINSGGPLPGRTDHVMAYDGYSVMMFGGKSSSGTGGVLDDQWAFNTGANTGSENTALVSSPSGRYKAAAAYFSAIAGSVMFGGCDTTRMFEEVWLWNSSDSGTWSQVAVANGTGPAARIDHCMASSTTKVYMFGGMGNGQVLFNDLWSFNGTTWTNTAATNPPSVRYNASLAYDSVNSVLVLFGGRNQSNYLDEVWTYDTTGSNAWTQHTPATLPSAKYSAGAAFDTTSSRTIIFGGVDATTGLPSSNTYAFNGSTFAFTQL